MCTTTNLSWLIPGYHTRMIQVHKKRINKSLKRQRLAEEASSGLFPKGDADGVDAKSLKRKEPTDPTQNTK